MHCQAYAYTLAEEVWEAKQNPLPDGERIQRRRKPSKRVGSSGYGWIGHVGGERCISVANKRAQDVLATGLLEGSDEYEFKVIDRVCDSKEHQADC